jgi:hypothetical protein
MIAASGLLAWATLEQGHDWGGDHAAYIMQAQSILAGNPAAFIEQNRFTIEGSTQAFSPLGPVAYPWGFPLLLAPFCALFGVDMLALKAVNISCYLLFLVVLAAGFRRLHSGAGGLALVGIFALNPVMLKEVDRIYADIPFLLVSTLTLVVIRHIILAQGRLVSRAADLVLVGLLIAVTCSLRTNGLLLLPALAWAQLYTRLTQPPSPCHGAGWLALIPYGSFLVAAGIWTLIFPWGGRVLLQYMQTTTPATLLSNAIYYLHLPTEFFNFNGGAIVYGATLPFFLLGAAQRLRSDGHLVIYIILTLLLFVCWPGRQGLRYLIPVLPLGVSLVISGIEGLKGRPHNRMYWPRILGLAGMFVVVFAFAWSSSTHAVRNLQRGREIALGPSQPKAAEMLDHIRRHTPPDAVIVFFKARVMRLLTGRPAIRIFKPDTIPRGDYLCVDLEDEAYRQLRMTRVRELFSEGYLVPVFNNAKWGLYRIAKPPVTPSTATLGGQYPASPD